MLQRFRRYFRKLEGLAPAELDRSAEALVLREKENVAKLIAHLAEMSRRKVALELGYKHLFDYCLRRLRLSEGSIALRLQVANAARRFPQLLVALAENRLSLTVAGLLAPHLTETNADELVAACEGMTKREAEEHLVSLRPKPVFQPSIRRQPSPSEPASPRPELRPQPAAAPQPPPLPPRTKTILEAAMPETFNFRFSADREFKDKLERLAEVLGVENPERRMAELLEHALDIALDKKDPKKKLERRERRAKAKAGSPTPSVPSSPRPDEMTQSESRYVASEVTERVLARAGYRCQFRSRAGTRCSSRTGLQIEHTRPFAIHRSHDERYLLAYCPAHNRFAAERVYGSAYIEGKIAESRQRAP